MILLLLILVLLIGGAVSWLVSRHDIGGFSLDRGGCDCD